MSMERSAVYCADIARSATAMRVSYTVGTTGAQAPITIDCPACGGSAVASTAHESSERVKLLGLIPLLKLTNTWIECGQCHKNIISTARLEQLRGRSPADIAPSLRFHPSGAAKALAVIALLTRLIPLIGLIIATIAWYVARGTKGWPAALSVLALILSCAVTI